MQNISAKEVKERISAGEQLNLIDVRQPEEIEVFNIGGIALPLSKIQSMQTEDIEDLMDEEVICYCRSGNRSLMAAMVLEQMGFSNVKNMTGGVEAYQDLSDDTD